MASSDPVIEMKDKMLELPLDKIQISEWDVRKYPEDPDRFASLIQSIREDGLMMPVTVMDLKNGKYLLVAGRRRLKACQELGWQNISAFVKGSDAEAWENDLVTVCENLHRRELVDRERCYGILHAYEIGGYTREQALQGTKYMHNNQELVS